MADDRDVQTLMRALKAAGHDQAHELATAILGPSSAAPAATDPAAAPAIGTPMPADTAAAIAAAEPSPDSPELTIDDVRKMSAEELANLSPEKYREAQDALRGAPA
jgi:hypothetical protein